MLEPDFKGGCRWMPTFQHSLQTGSERKPEMVTVTCCNCASKVDYVESWTCVAYGVHGNRLPLPTFLHCRSCALILDANVAFRRAYGKDHLAAAPDPVKVLRQEELDRQYAAPDQPEHRHE